MVGEALIGKLVHAKYDFAVVISTSSYLQAAVPSLTFRSRPLVPLRNTSLTHLRDAFARALVSRLKLPQVTSALTPEENEVSHNILMLFPSFFSNIPPFLFVGSSYSSKHSSILFPSSCPTQRTRLERLPFKLRGEPSILTSRTSSPPSLHLKMNIQSQLQLLTGREESIELNFVGNSVEPCLS